MCLCPGKSIDIYSGRIGPKLVLEGEAPFATSSKKPTATVEVERGGELFVYDTAPHINPNAFRRVSIRLLLSQNGTTFGSHQSQSSPKRHIKHY